MRCKDRWSVMSVGLVAIFALLVISGGAHAAYPERPVQIICPWGAGGGTDQVARTIGAILQEDLGVPFNVVNRTGAVEL